MERINKKLPVGVEDFSKIRTEGFYYIDKTGLIKELLNNWGEVNLFTRPRRFGKSLNMSMLKSFLEIGCDKALFDGLKISKETALCEEFMGKFPVVSISLKGVNGNGFNTAREMLCSVIGTEAMRFQFLLESDRLTEKEKMQYHQLTMIDTTNQGSFVMSDSILMGSLKTLSMLLQKYYGTKVIILIDEYDVPLAKANENGYYDQMVTLIRVLFEQALKTNDHLQFAVLTGCLRVAKESIFTGLNNLKVLSITSVSFDESFGFTDEEVKALLEYYGLSNCYSAVKDWYDGYHFGNVDVYCPWDVISYIDERRVDSTLVPKNYWSNTSSNDVVRHFIEKADAGTTKREIERLIAGDFVVKEIHQELTYKEMYDSIENIWSVLFTTGYLTQRGRLQNDVYQLVIPNMEIRTIFTGQIMKLFKESVKKDGSALNAFCDALKNGDADGVERQFEKYLKKTISIRDTFVRKTTKENFYHGILLGILGFKESWGVSSNKEAGDGYNDIQVEIDDEDIGIIIEVKYAHNADLESGCTEALEQINKNGYAEQLREDGMQTILKYGIACYKKKCRVLLEREE
ncbi:MAG: AAA family ATPase [Eubacteriales bacterium]|nr:AAA family ATPase [Eubacteriales bacterium]